MLVGYMRVSTAEQNLALQRDALLAAGVEPERIYEDTCSGAVADRPGLILGQLNRHERRQGWRGSSFMPCRASCATAAAKARRIRSTR